MTTTNHPTSFNSAMQLWCPCCGQPLDIAQQRDYRVKGTIAYFTLGTCRNPSCLLSEQTLGLRALQGDLSAYELPEHLYDVLTGAYMPAWMRVWFYDLAPESEG